MNKEIDAVAKNLKSIYDDAYEIYSEKCTEFTASKSISKSQTERLLDGLLDFCGDERFVMLYRKICKYAFPVFPETVAEYINLYKELYTDNGGLK